MKPITQTNFNSIYVGLHFLVPYLELFNFLYLIPDLLFTGKFLVSFYGNFVVNFVFMFTRVLILLEVEFRLCLDFGKMGLISGILMGMIFGIASMAGWRQMMKYRSSKRIAKVYFTNLHSVYVVEFTFRSLFV